MREEQPEIKDIKDTQDVESKTETAKKRPSISKAVLVILLILVLCFASAAGAYYWRDSQANSFEKQQTDSIAQYKNTVASLQKQLAGVPDSDSTPCTETSPNASTIENIQASITSGNTAALEGYMATTVNVILAATEAYGPQTRTQAIGDISAFISDDINSWNYDFSLPNATLNSYQDGDYAQYFPDIAVVGKASNNKVISFSFDCNGKIDTVFMSSDAALL